MARFALNPDYRDFLSECNAQNVEYLVIGGQAVIFYGYVRNTKDLAIWINLTPENAICGRSPSTQPPVRRR